MRPLRLLLSLSLLLITILLTFYSLLFSHPRHSAKTSSPSGGESGHRSYFSFHIPSVLFPPSAIISLTDDNSTFFVSRPADYGPLLPTDGLSGQLWIGSGFGAESLSKVGLVAQAEGELGCSDIPGWTEGQGESFTNRLGDATNGEGSQSTGSKSSLREKNTKSSDKTSTGETGHKTGPVPKEEDGTDDFLHYPLRGAPLVKGRSSGRKQQASNDDDRLEHADIQALQESAEIAGKVVLLSRGGCGFLEKTKWVQRRGGIALIVGDNVRGGGLIMMYAHGDTSNITIPSLFTTRTSAHLLSSLIPDKKGNHSEEAMHIHSDPTKSPLGATKGGTKVNQDSGKGTTFTSAVYANNKGGSSSKAKDSSSSVKKPGWFSSLKSGLGLGSETRYEGGSQPPSSGENNWVLSEDWDDLPSPAVDKTAKDTSNSKSDQSKQGTVSAKQNAKESDGFVIGVQDWRDPDMIGPVVPQSDGSARTRSHSTSTALNSLPSMGNNGVRGTDKTLSGGSVMPGSGVYDEVGGPTPPKHTSQREKGINGWTEDHGWWNRLFRIDYSGTPASRQDSTEQPARGNDASTFIKEKDFRDFEDIPSDREGLWVTMTPASMSTTPFFDTLLILVVSPLVTLTIVYALLILRSRIRRRRWRAPKSVVERLPVRTYHTMSCSSSSTSSQTPSPNSSSPTSPLLRTDSRSTLSRNRPRSRTTSTLSDHSSDHLEDAQARSPLSSRTKGRLPRKYKGKQVECVVCLEEYVDGQSRVMSLPCGHEFHAECITPWLTTRRRTCPICKGDVVRSLNNGESASSTRNSLRSRYQDDPESMELQSEVAASRNDSPSAAIPIPRNADDDLERGDDMAETLVNDGPTTYTTRRGWREFAARSLSAFSGSTGRSWTQQQEDRNR